MNVWVAWAHAGAIDANEGSFTIAADFAGFARVAISEALRSFIVIRNAAGATGAVSFITKLVAAGAIADGGHTTEGTQREQGNKEDGVGSEFHDDSHGVLSTQGLVRIGVIARCVPNPKKKISPLIYLVLSGRWRVLAPPIQTPLAGRPAIEIPSLIPSSERYESDERGHRR
jgi:hypothetical protein